MMPTHVYVEFNDFGKYAANLETVARHAVQRTIKRIELRAKVSLSGPRSGREYVKSGYKNKIMHRASAPGEAPATDTGHLANSIRSRMTGRTEGEITVNAEYAAALELGSVHIAPRPFFGPAVKAEWPAFLAEMKQVAE